MLKKRCLAADTDWLPQNCMAEDHAGSKPAVQRCVDFQKALQRMEQVSQVAEGMQVTCQAMGSKVQSHELTATGMALTYWSVTLGLC